MKSWKVEMIRKKNQGGVASALNPIEEMVGEVMVIEEVMPLAATVATTEK